MGFNMAQILAIQWSGNKGAAWTAGYGGFEIDLTLATDSQTEGAKNSSATRNNRNSDRKFRNWPRFCILNLKPNGAQDI